MGSKKKRARTIKSQRTSGLRGLLAKHFRGVGKENLVTTSRVFPITALVDLQVALDRILSSAEVASELVGLHASDIYQTLSFAHLLQVGKNRGEASIGPLQFDDVEVGHKNPARCLKMGLWLARSSEGRRFAVLLSPEQRHGRDLGRHVEIAVPSGEENGRYAQDFMRGLEKAVHEAGSYRGRVISLEMANDYSGRSSGIRVHRLSPVQRDQVILPAKTLALLERNILQFVEHRTALRGLNMNVKKGILFYGPPGTGKTHTIHYLASQLPNHTTLLITAEQVVLLSDYVQLARFLQPAMIVIEDADLIARSRTSMHSPCEESLLNKLLNEMDGLREDAEILFVLTTNRPDQLESALAGRPGRIDQAIEFPLPDEVGREKLIHLYSGQLELDSNITEQLVKKTKGGSAAFIKELMRRGAQSAISRGDGRKLQPAHINEALDEMLFSGGSLNRALLGTTATAV